MTCDAPGVHAYERSKKPQYPTVVSNGLKLNARADYFSAIKIPLATALDNGSTSRLTGVFQDVLPADKPWNRLPVGHATQGLAYIRAGDRALPAARYSAHVLGGAPSA